MSCNFIVRLVKKNESVFKENLYSTYCSPSFSEYTVKISQLPDANSLRYACIEKDYFWPGQNHSKISERNLELQKSGATF